MIVLSINTSREASIALTKDDLLLGELALDVRNSYLPNILAMIDYLLKETHLTINDVDLFSVVLGPGSWSGLRIGVTTAKSMAHALNKPIVGVSTLDLLAYNLRYTERLVYPTISSKNGYVFYAAYDCTEDFPKRLTDFKHEKVIDFLSQCKANSILLVDNSLRNKMELTPKGADEFIVRSCLLSRIRGSFVNEVGFQKFMSSGADETLALAPLYLQEAEAEIKHTLRHDQEEG